MKNLISLITILCFFNLLNVYAQDTKSLKLPNKIQTIGDKVKVKDGTTVLMEVENEGVAGSIILPPLSIISSLTDNKLYNINNVLYWHGSKLVTSGSSLWTLNVNDIYYNSGNVGIGSSNLPSAKLTVRGNGTSLIHGESAVYLSLGNEYFDYEDGLVFRGSGTGWSTRFTSTSAMEADGEIVGIYKNESTEGNVRNDAGSLIATFNNNGNVGIGTTTTPSAKLTIDGGGTTATHGQSSVFIADDNQYFDYQDGLVFRGSGTGWATRFTSTSAMEADGEIVGIYKKESTEGDVRGDSGNPIATFNNNGNVGIGTDSPGSKLSIIGLSVYADNAAAITAGLSVGDLYRTGDLLKIVH